MATPENKLESVHCNACGRFTDHLIARTYRNREYSDDLMDQLGRVFDTVHGFCDWELLECQGCKTVCLRSKEFCSEWVNPYDTDNFSYQYFPPRNTSARVKPHWFDKFVAIESLQGHFILGAYKQIYELMEAKNYLAAMLTCRALLETLAIEHGDGDRGTFQAKLESLREKDFIRSKQILYLNKTIYDAGSAAMHRSYNPSAKAVTYVIDAIEQLLHTIYIESLVEEELQDEKPSRIFRS